MQTKENQNKRKFLFVFKANSLAKSCFCCFSLDTAVQIIGWLGLLSSAIELVSFCYYEIMNFILDVIKIIAFAFLIAGYNSSNTSYLLKCYKILTVLFYAKIGFLVFFASRIRANRFHSEVTEELLEIFFYSFVFFMTLVLAFHLYFLWIIYSYIESLEAAQMQCEAEEKEELMVFSNEESYLNSKPTASINQGNYNTIA